MGRKTGYKHSQETKKKLSNAHKGKKFSEEHKKYLGKSHKGKNGYWLGKKRLSMTGEKHPMFKKHHSKETLKKISDKLKGRKVWNKGLKGWNKGHFVSEETKIKISKTQSGNKNHNWQGGIWDNPYSVDWTRTLRRSIRERDKYTCQLCNKQQEDITFCIHHIDYNKENCNPNNLITLCRSCHSKTNCNRKYWTKYFLEVNFTL